MYRAVKVSGELQLNHEHTAWQYFKVEEIPFHKDSPINPVLLEYIARHKNVIQAENP
jgi:hypothetical protein